MQSMSPEQRRQLAGDDAVAPHAGRAAGGGAARSSAMNLDQLMPLDEMRAPLPLPGRRGALAAGGHAAHGRAAADGRARAPAPQGAATRATSRRSIPQQVEQLLGEEAAQRPRAAARDDQEARGGRLPRAQGRPARADRAGHPQDRPTRRCTTSSRSSSATASAATRSTTAARAATAPTRPSATSSAIRSCSTCKETLMNAVERRRAGHAGAPGARRLRGLPHRAADPGGHRGHARHEPLDDLQRLLPARQEGRAGAPRADPRPVPARQPVHRGLLALRARVHRRSAARPRAERVRTSAPTCTRASCSRASSWRGTRAATSRSS